MINTEIKEEVQFGLWHVDEKGNIDYKGDWTYGISCYRLTEPDWETHMAEKPWVAINDFKAALSQARINRILDLESLFSPNKPYLGSKPQDLIDI